MMTKKKAERLATDAKLDDLLRQVAELRTLLENIGRMLDSADSPLHFHPQTGALTDEPVVLDPPTIDNDMVTVAEAATILSVSAFTVRNYCTTGKLAAVQINKRGDWRITRGSVLDEWNRRYG